MDQDQVFPFEQAIMHSKASRRPAEPFFRRVWAPALVALGFALTLTWVALMAYGLAVFFGFSL
jgi:hypothetical protein